MTLLWEHKLGNYFYDLYASCLDEEGRERFEIKNDEMALERWVEQNHKSFGTKAFVRYSTYKNSDYRYRIGDLDIAIMRSAKQVMKRKYDGVTLAERYLRRIRFVGLTHRDVLEMNNNLRERIMTKKWADALKIRDHDLLRCLALDFGKPVIFSGETKAQMLIYRVSTYYDRQGRPWTRCDTWVSSDEYYRLLREVNRDQKIIETAVKVIEEVEEQAKARTAADIQREQRIAAQRKSGRIAAREKEAQRLIAVAMCEELGWMPDIKQKAKALAVEGELQ